MHTIHFISTTHKENGACNAQQLCEMIECINPDVIFLEALEDTYSRYDQYLFNQFGIFHKKLEVEAIQRYSYKAQFEYIPVLDFGLSNTFEEKYNIVCENKLLQEKIINYSSRAYQYGFRFLNSDESVLLQDDMRKLEDTVLKDFSIKQKFMHDVNEYENAMLKNIYNHSVSSKFKRGLFMCGVAHRKSIIKKIKEFNNSADLKLNWKISGI